VTNGLSKQANDIRKNDKQNRLLRELVNKAYRQRYLLFMAYLGLAYIIIFYYVPIYGIVIAFKDFDVTKGFFGGKWIGLDHFREFLSDSYFFLILRNTLAINFLRLLVGFPLSITLAILFNEITHNRFRGIVQSVFYVPYFISWVIMAGFITTILNPQSGILNEILIKIGIVDKGIDFLGNNKWTWTIFVLSDVYKTAGFNSILFTAAIYAIDPTLYEATYIDGAKKVQQIMHITLPSIMPTIIVLLLLNVGWMMNSNFDQIFLLQNSLTLETTEVIDTYVYKTGLKFGRFDYAAAINLFKNLLGLSFLVTTNVLVKKIKIKTVI